MLPTQVGGGINYGLYISATTGSVWDFYNNFGYNHTSYPMVRGGMKNFSDFAGRQMSQQALKYSSLSKNVKMGGNIGTGLMVFQSAYNFYNGDRSVLNYSDGFIGLTGLGNTFIQQFGGAGSAAIGPAVAWYGALRIMVDASAGERGRIQDNIMNNRDPLYNVYNPGLPY